jgi:hypothetical protein
MAFNILTSFGFFFLIGAGLGLRVQFLVLVPIICFVAPCIGGVQLHHGDRWEAVMLMVVTVVVALQSGYLFGGIVGAAIDRLDAPTRKAILSKTTTIPE